MRTGHTVHAFDAELTELRRTIADMGATVERQFADALQALVEHDSARAAETIGGDAAIDQAELAVEALVVRMLALRQPMANDLREVVSALKIASNIERIGDFASNIAKRSLALGQEPPTGALKSVSRLGQAARLMIRDVVAAYARDDAALAAQVRARDSEVDALYSSLFRELLTYMMESPQQITACTHLLFVAKNIERVGDHATNVAEHVIYAVTGRMPTDERPKDDRSSFTVVELGNG